MGRGIMGLAKAPLGLLYEREGFLSLNAASSTSTPADSPPLSFRTRPTYGNSRGEANKGD